MIYTSMENVKKSRCTCFIHFYLLNKGRIDHCEEGTWVLIISSLGPQNFLWLPPSLELAKPVLNVVSKDANL